MTLNWNVYSTDYKIGRIIIDACHKSIVLFRHLQQSKIVGLFSKTTNTRDLARQLCLDDHFSLELQKLVTQYIQHITRPFPLKVFVDLTDPKR